MHRRYGKPIVSARVPARVLHSLDSVARSKGITRADCLRAAAEAWIQANTDMLALVELIGTDPVPFNRKAMPHTGTAVGGDRTGRTSDQGTDDPRSARRAGWLTEPR
jgi:hypothetical protein